MARALEVCSGPRHILACDAPHTGCPASGRPVPVVRDHRPRRPTGVAAAGVLRPGGGCGGAKPPSSRRHPRRDRPGGKRAGGRGGACRAVALDDRRRRDGRLHALGARGDRRGHGAASPGPAQHRCRLLPGEPAAASRRVSLAGRGVRSMGQRRVRRRLPGVAAAADRQLDRRGRGVSFLGPRTGHSLPRAGPAAMAGYHAVVRRRGARRCVGAGSAARRFGGDRRRPHLGAGRAGHRADRDSRQRPRTRRVADRVSHDGRLSQK